MKETILLALMLLAVAAGPLRAEDARAVELAKAVWKAHGGEAWHAVKRIRFTFNVGQDGKTLLSAAHDWQVSEGRDTVTWGDHSATANLFSDKQAGELEEKAYARWVNDSYWLLAPLKLLDKGVVLKYGGEQEVEGMKFEVLHLSYEDVGLTPRDRYNLYIDPETKLVRRWDYMPNPEKKVSATWEGYKEFGGLKLATEHRMGDKRIYFTDISVEGE